MKLSIDLAACTWSQLAEVVRAGRDNGHLDGDRVPWEVAADDPSRIVSLSVDIMDPDWKSVAIPHSERLRFAAVLKDIIDRDGDAQMELFALGELREHLLGVHQFED